MFEETYGWRGKIGLLVPSVNTTIEPDFWKMAPAGVTIHGARLKTERLMTFETLRDMEKSTESAAAAVADAQVGVIAYGCTSGSFFGGHEWNTQIVEKMTKNTGIPSLTTTGAMIRSLEEKKLKKISVVTPYVPKTNEELKKYLNDGGINVLDLKAFEILDGFDHAAITPWQVYDLVKKADKPEAEGIFIACTQVRAITVLDALEEDLKKPVISANQATLWLSLKTLGFKGRIDGYGCLLHSF
jgi:maleate cis-trans isomerase